jgi:hypothetical protein
MSRKLLVAAVALLTALALSLGLASAGSASLWAAVHLPLQGPYFLGDAGRTYNCGDGAKAPSRATFGSVVMREAPGTVAGKINLRGAAPNSLYGFIVEENPGDCGTSAQSGFLFTNADGNATAEFSVPRIPGAARFWIAMGTSFSGPFILSRAVSFR